MLNELSRPQAVDLFGGCGGTITGFALAGFHVVSTVELDTDAVKVVSLNHPDTRVINRDIRELDARSLFPAGRSCPDLVTACPPCQGFSAMTTKNGAKSVQDPRNLLVFEVVRIVRALMPKMVVIENVPALLRSQEYLSATAELKQFGYLETAGVLNAMHFGVAQRRLRAIAVFSRVSVPELARPTNEAPLTVADVIADLVVPRNHLWMHDVDRKTSELVRLRIAAVPHDGGGRQDLPEHLQLDCHRRLRGYHDVYGRMRWNAPAPTLTRFCNNPSKGRFLHPDLDRTISPYEALLLQGFPRNYRFDRKLPIGKIVSMIGEAFPPKWAKAIGCSVLSQLPTSASAIDDY